MCGEIWLLATTLKNAKMLIQVGLGSGLFHINVLCFVTAPHDVGLFLCPKNEIYKN
jgi:hypothetical protein